MNPRINPLSILLVVQVLFVVVVSAFTTTTTPAFVVPPKSATFWLQTGSTTTRLYQSSFAADGSEYSSKKDFEDDEAERKRYDRSSSYHDDDQDDTPTVELEPVGMSQNSGNRFVAVIWDRELDTQGRDALDLHYDRIELTEDHVMFCRKANLYNETFNTNSMVDVLWSLPM